MSLRNAQHCNWVFVQCTDMRGAYLRLRQCFPGRAHCQIPYFSVLLHEVSWRGNTKCAPATVPIWPERRKSLQGILFWGLVCFRLPKSCFRLSAVLISGCDSSSYVSASSTLATRLGEFCAFGVLLEWFSLAAVCVFALLCADIVSVFRHAYCNRAAGFR